MASVPLDDAQRAAALPPPRRIFRNRLSTRLWHWLNVVALVTLLMSGLMIFNAHPRLYWGQYGANMDKAWLEIGATGTQGYLKIGDRRWDTSGVLGYWKDGQGNIGRGAFPGWATIPSTYNLAMARRWHLSFAWIFAFGLLFFMIRSLWNGHIRKDLAIGRDDIKPSAIVQDIKDHLKLRFHHGDARFNILQKFSYVGVIFILLPLMIFTGLTMSPGINAAWPWLLDLFGGRQSARSIHFIVAGLLVAFVIVHLALVLLSGPVNGIRSMITGWFRLPAEKGA